MNQRFQSAEIRLVSERFSENDLYKAICTIGCQLETELIQFGLCPQECFMEVLEVLSHIAEKGEDIIPELDNIWHRKFNEYRRFDRSVDEDEIRKVVGIVLGFVILAIDSSHHSFYHYTLVNEITTIIVNHKFEAWTVTLNQIVSVPLADGWFDTFIDEEPEGDDDVIDIVDNVSALRNQIPGSTIVQFVQNQYNNSCQQFMGKMEKTKIIYPNKNEAI